LEKAACQPRRSAKLRVDISIYSFIVKRDKEDSLAENRYYVLGRTNLNRLLFAVFTVRGEKIRIISARDMTATETERYLK